MANLYIHEVKLASDEIHESAGPAGTAIAEGRTWALNQADPAQGYSLGAAMSGFVVSVSSAATNAVLVSLDQAPSASPAGDAGVVPVLPGMERYVRADEGQTLYAVEAA